MIIIGPHGGTCRARNVDCLGVKPVDEIHRVRLSRECGEKHPLGHPRPRQAQGCGKSEAGAHLPRGEFRREQSPRQGQFPLADDHLAGRLVAAERHAMSARAQRRSQGRRGLRLNGQQHRAQVVDQGAVGFRDASRRDEDAVARAGAGHRVVGRVKAEVAADSDLSGLAAGVLVRIIKRASSQGAAREGEMDVIASRVAVPEPHPAHALYRLLEERLERNADDWPPGGAAESHAPGQRERHRHERLCDIVPTRQRL